MYYSSVILALVAHSTTTDAFQTSFVLKSGLKKAPSVTPSTLQGTLHDNQESFTSNISKTLSNIATATLLSTSLILATAATPVHAEDELAAKYGGKGFDSSLVDQTCLVDKCSLTAKACLADDPSCRKGLTCTAKCMGDNSCITGCMARYGNENLDNLLKCTIEDNECIKVAILPGGADSYGEEPLPPAPTVRNFDMMSMEGTWYKVVGFNPNYDCYACQRNTFTSPDSNDVIRNPFNDKLQVDVEFSMPRMLPDGSPPPPSNVREQLTRGEDGLVYGSQTIGFNDYATRETMVFDKAGDPASKVANLVLKNGQDEKSYARTAHSEGEMFGLKFWENWYVIGENDPGQPEFKFVYYNGKTRQNTYEGAFVYSRTKELDESAMAKVYSIASNAGMNPDQFCKIRNGCFKDEAIASPPSMYRRVMASTKISQLLGVEPVAAEFVPVKKSSLSLTAQEDGKRKWWHEVGDYLEDPHRHFKVMESLRVTMDWPESVKQQ
jgi:hypothetical protein